jgi:hypothetical protein
MSAATAAVSATPTMSAAMAKTATGAASELASTVKPALKSVRPGVGMVIIAVARGIIRIVVVRIGGEVRIVAGEIVISGIRGSPGRISRTPRQGQGRTQEQHQKDQSAHHFTAL